jgi:DNA-binding response OmpR family regulator
MAKKRVLVIDDEHDFVEILRVILEDKNYEVTVAYDGEEGLEKAEREKPDLIILDINMPKIKGFDVCRKLKIDKNFKDIPIIMLSAAFQPSDIKFAVAMGADAYLTKGSENHVLLEKIQELLKEKQ